MRQGTLGEYRYLEHGAHWAIGALATILLLELAVVIPKIVTGLLGLAFIVAAFFSSVRANRRDAAELLDSIDRDRDPDAGTRRVGSEA